MNLSSTLKSTRRAESWTIKETLLAFQDLKFYSRKEKRTNSNNKKEFTYRGITIKENIKELLKT